MDDTLRSLEVSVGKLTEKVDGLAVLLNERTMRFDSLRDEVRELRASIDVAERQGMQLTSGLQSEAGALRQDVSRLDTNQADIGKRVRALEDSRAKLIGFAIGLSVVAGGTAGAVAQFLEPGL